MVLATLCHIRKNGKTLMMHRAKNPKDIHLDKWLGLGGKMESGESPEDCVIREVREESGLRISNPRLRGIITFPSFGGHGNTDDWYIFVFTATSFSGKLKGSREGRIQWIEDKKLLRLNMWEGDRIFIKWLDKDRFFSAKLTYKNEKFVGHTVKFY